jgi:cyclopropane fatty-acyl-phospholipid synthase-like methyltransferase
VQPSTTPNVDPKLTVARGYDRIAEGYLLWRTTLGREKRDLGYIERLAAGLPEGARVLDLGCGAGTPYTSYLSERFETAGIDISRAQLALAQAYAPQAALVLGDMASLPFAPESFDAVTAIYSIIHVPREEHESLLAGVHALLRPGGRALVVLGANAWEGIDEDWLDLGATMFWSHYGADSSRALVERAGFRIMETAIEEDDDHDSWHLFVVAEKPA